NQNQFLGKNILFRSKSLLPPIETRKLYVKINWKNFDKFKNFYISENGNVNERFKVILKTIPTEKSKKVVYIGKNEHYDVFKFELNKYCLTTQIRIEVEPLLGQIHKKTLNAVQSSEHVGESSTSTREENNLKLPTLWGVFEFNYGMNVFFKYGETDKNPRPVITDNLPLKRLFPFVNLKFEIKIPNNYIFKKLFCHKIKENYWFKIEENGKNVMTENSVDDQQFLINYIGHVCPEDNYEFYFIKIKNRFEEAEIVSVMCNEILNKEKHVYKIVGSVKPKNKLFLECFDGKGLF
uniref:Uncharacterized protein n=1 Tax=Meloidogyne hapla TaxID=6305 RepID=A0A1I8BHL4_MELHA